MSSAQRLSLAQLRIQAKELLRAVREAEPEALKRALVYFDPKSEFCLANAQLVLAREHGFPAWAALKRSLETDHETPPNPSKSFFKAVEDGDLEAVGSALAESPELCSAWRQTVHGYWESALHVSAQRGSIEIARLLIDAGADVYAVRQSGYPPVSDAYDRGQTEMVEFLLAASAKQDHGHPPTYGVGIDIVLAARMGWLDRVRMHVERDPFAVYRRGCIGETVLHWPAHNGHVEVLSYLLEHDAVVEADEIGLYGGKPLHWAAEHSPKTVAILLERGADPNARNLMPGEFEGYTPLHMCARQGEECVECAQMLLVAGADHRLKDTRGDLAQDVAKANGRLTTLAFLEDL